MSKRKLIILYTLTSLVFVLSIMAVFGAFLFEEKVTVTTNLGNITTINKGFVTYAPGTVTDNTYTGLDITDYSTTTAYKTALKTRQSTPQDINTSSIICYATEKEGYKEEKNEYFYLNQLGLRFDIAASIDVCVRIHFEDAWILIKTVGGTESDPQYIRKASLSASYPFSAPDGDTDWYYDINSNSVYYKHVIDSDEETATQDSSNNYIHSLSYDVNASYFYEFAANEIIANGHQAVLVEVSFTVDVVQANRAYKIWNVDPLTIGS
jgi:hypothetical protein